MLPEIQQFLGLKRKCDNKSNTDVVLMLKIAIWKRALPAQF